MLLVSIVSQGTFQVGVSFRSVFLLGEEGPKPQSLLRSWPWSDLDKLQTPTLPEWARGRKEVFRKCPCYAPASSSWCCSARLLKRERERETESPGAQSETDMQAWERMRVKEREREGENPEI